MGRLSPRLTIHVNRFDGHHIELDSRPLSIDYRSV